MSTAVTDYDFRETLHESPRTTVRRAVRRRDGLQVVLKALASKYPTPHELSQVRQEYRIARQIHAPGIVEVHGLEAHGNGLAIVAEDFHGPPLSGQASAIAGNLDDFFSIAMGLVRVLAHVHKQVIHGDLSPSNLLWARDTRELRLIDFGSSSELGRGSQGLAAEELSESSLPYVAPERSGRMSRVPDHRSDLYSLGAIFYELLTGRSAFSARDRAEWHYCHATCQPRPPSKTPDVPEALWQIVVRLMAKNPEDRFQSALGLLVDLQECEKRWRSTGRIEGVAIGRRDVGDVLRMPKRLYGREVEMQALVSVFEAVARGATRVVMVSGEPGVGKSALVRDLRRAATNLDGYFCEGKFDQFRRQAPYAGLADALRQVVVQILCEPERKLNGWSASLREALAPNGRLVVELVAAFEHVIGAQPPVALANPVEAQNRFQATIATLVQTLAGTEGPLVMFLDDLQWADVATLALLRRLLGDRSTARLLFIGAYRDVEDTHPLGGLVGQMSREGLLTPLHLSALEPSAVNELVADALGVPQDRTTALSGVLHEKAHGNPLVVRELLGTLHRERVIAFRSERGDWEWEIDRVARWGTSDDVVELLLQRLRALPIETQSWLKLAACLGASFSLRTLSVIGETPPARTVEALQRAVQEGLIIPVDEARTLPRESVGEDHGGGSGASAPGDVRYEFLHDRVQQAAYALVTRAEKSALHLRIGRLLLRHATPAEREERLIEIARHWSEGVDFLQSDEERLELAGLNHDAARKAKRSVAYGPALELAKAAVAALPPDAWKDSFDRTYEIHHLLAECAYLVGARTPLEKGRVHAMQVVQLTFLQRMDDAVAAGLKGLRLLGVRLAAHPSTATILKELLLAKRALGGRPIAELEHAPVLQDPAVRLGMRILIDFIPPAYLTGNDRLFAAAVLKQVRLSLRHGSGPEAAAAYASYVVLLAGLGDLESAEEFGRLAMRLTDRFKANEMRCRNQVLYALFGQSWNRPWRELRPCFQEAVRAGLDSGDLLFAAYGCGWIHLWDPDLDVRSALDEARKHLTIIEKTSYQNARDAALLSQQFLANLLGETESPLSLSDARFDEEACQQRMTHGRNVSGLGIRALYRITLCALYEEHERGFEIAIEAQPQIRALAGSPYLVEYCLHAFLVCASLPKSTPGRRAARRLMARLRRMMGKWARHAPANFRAHELLMEAEWTRLNGDVGAATRLYEQAVVAARDGRFARYEALANERAARFHASQGVERVASMYRLEARYHYARWGATRKVRLLEERYPSLLDEAGPARSGSGRDSRRGRTSEAEEPRLDVATVWKASQTISEEV
ncbi:MAG TPA: serine/threonine-protein kinase PknK, partial [Polyangiaceae bacterium]|nr:serine/threonine-protein kinase PknK [Polyangiaceae bacterium]